MIGRGAALLVALLVPTVLFGAAEPGAEIREDFPSLVGRLLIAAPDMPVAKYQKIVIVVTRNGPDGSLGVAINRPAGDQPWTSFFTVIGQPKQEAEGRVPMYSGGPMEPERFFILHSTDYHQPETLPLGGGVATTSASKIFHDVYEQKGPKKFLIAFGYVGWAPGQLEAAIAQKAWTTAPVEASMVFDADRDTLWQQLTMKHAKAPLDFGRARTGVPASVP